MASADAAMEKVHSHMRYKTEKDAFTNEIKIVNTKIQRSNSLRTSIYDDYMEQILTEQDYLYAKSNYEKDESLLKIRLNELLIQQKKYHETYAYENKSLSAFREFREEQVLSREMLTSLVQAVELHSNKTIEVKFKFKDEYDELLSYINILEIEVKPNAR